VKLYVDLDRLELIEGPGFRNPVSTLRFKRGDAARLEVVFLTNGTTPTAIGDPETLEIHFGAKLNGQFGTDYVVHTADWTLPDPEATTPVYSCTPSFNTTALNEALDLGGGESAEVALMGEITWRDGTGEPTSTRTVLVIVENDVNRGTEGTPQVNPNPAEWLAEHGVTVVYRTAYEGHPDTSLPEVFETPATGTISILGIPADGDLVSITHPAKTAENFVFKTTAVDPFEVQIDPGDALVCLQNLAYAIDANSAIISSSTYPSTTDYYVQAHASLLGETGNDIALSSTGSYLTHDAYLAGGADGIPAVLAINGASPGQQCRVGDVHPYSWYRWTGDAWVYFPHDEELVHRSGNESIAGAKSFSGQMELTGQSAPNPTSAMTRRLVEAAVLDAMTRVRDPGLGVAVTNGGTASSTDADALSSGTAANARPLIYRWRTITRNPVNSSNGNYVVPMTFATLAGIYHPGSTNAGGRIRFGIGMLASASCPAGNANALGAADRGFGWEVFWNGSAVVFGLFANNGTTYVATDGVSGRPAPVVLGMSASFDQFIYVKISLSAAGVVSAWLWFGTDNSAATVLPASPTLTLSGGPTSGAFNAAGHPCWVTANHSTNAATTQMFLRVIDRALLLD
jgi:hypothetical protein